MMTDPKKGGALAIILAKAKGAKPEDGDGPDDEGPADYMDDLKAASEDFLKAIEEKDPSAVAEAFSAMHDICANHE